MCYPFSEALRARIRVLLGQGPAVTDSSLAKRPQSAIAALRGNGCTGCYGTKVCFDLQRLSVPMVRYGGRPGFPQIMLRLLHAGRPGLQLSTRALCRSGQ